MDKISKTIFLEKKTQATGWLLLIIGVSIGIHLFFMASSDLLVEEAYYWNYAQHLDFSYLDHPPMVALLIKVFTSFLGTNELSVRMASLVCWLLTAFFSYRLAHLLHPGAGVFAGMLLAVLPFFFIQTLVITPDLPLIVCWSASVYYLYRALVLNQSDCWYITGFWLGLGMISKYTISLLGLATFFYLITVPGARVWFKRKEPYLGALISLLLFTPVIYWNATHEWVSFLFQSKRRFESVSTIDLPYLIALIFLFITPFGILDLWAIFKKKTQQHVPNSQAVRFMQIFILFPLSFFAIFSLNHRINFNWIGPIFLTLVCWIAVLIGRIPQKKSIWLKVSLGLLGCYIGIILTINLNTSQAIQQKLFIKLISWESLTKQFNEIAQQIETDTKKSPIFIPLDHYSIASELSFYQAKLLAYGNIKKSYSVIGAHIFGRDSLMYRYWSNNEEFAGRPLILVSTERWRFNIPGLPGDHQSPIKRIWSTSQNQKVKNIPFYYKVTFKEVA